MPTTAPTGGRARDAAARGGSGSSAWLGPDYRLGFLFVLPIVVLVLALVAYPFG